MIVIIPQIFVVLERSMIQCDCLNEGFSLRTLICSKLDKRFLKQSQKVLLVGHLIVLDFHEFLR